MAATAIAALLPTLSAVEPRSDQPSLASHLQSLISHVSFFTKSALSSSQSSTSLGSDVESSAPTLSESSTPSEREEGFSGQSSPSQISHPALPAASQPVRVSTKWTSFQYAYPPPGSRRSYSRRRGSAQLLLQLRRMRSSRKSPLPVLEVYPAPPALRHLKQPKPLIAIGAHTLSKNDILITNYSSYSDDINSADGHADDTPDAVALLHHCSCTINGSAIHQDAIQVLDRDWLATGALGRYNFQAIGSPHCCVYWIARLQEGSLTRSASTPVSSVDRKTSTISTAAFDMILETSAGVDVGVAYMDIKGIRVRDLLAEMNSPEGRDLSASLAFHTACSPTAYTSTAAGSLNAIVGPDFASKRVAMLAVATGIWVAVREGWLKLGGETDGGKRKTGESGRAKACKLLALGKSLVRKRSQST